MLSVKKRTLGGGKIASLVYYFTPPHTALQ